MIMCVLLCYPVSLQLLSTGRPISSCLFLFTPYPKGQKGPWWRCGNILASHLRDRSLNTLHDLL